MTDIDFKRTLSLSLITQQNRYLLWLADEGSYSFNTVTEFQKLLSVAVIPGLSPFNNVLLFSHFHVMRKQFINIVKLLELLLKDGENTKTSKPDMDN